MIDSLFLLIGEKQKISRLHPDFGDFVENRKSILFPGAMGQLNIKKIIVQRPDETRAVHAVFGGSAPAVGNPEILFDFFFKLLFF